ncbi:uncharacterized protein LOC141660858 [Apium graveolens]|uniref:uncharacterized protein LOC141660858 n=1 Tax=Apium graveolens TaxID=4045 RepID=UPI003D7B6FA8
MYYATKWIEARPLAKIREKEMVEFLMEHIVFSFGVPRIVVTDIGTQFIGEKFTHTLSQLKIKHIKSSVAYPQANGQVENDTKVNYISFSFQNGLRPRGRFARRGLPQLSKGRAFDPATSQESLPFHNILMEEVRDETTAKVLLQQTKTTAYFNKKVKIRQFLVGDLVLRESAASQPTLTGKFKESLKPRGKVPTR